MPPDRLERRQKICWRFIEDPRYRGLCEDRSESFFLFFPTPLSISGKNFVTILLSENDWLLRRIKVKTPCAVRYRKNPTSTAFSNAYETGKTAVVSRRDDALRLKSRHLLKYRSSIDRSEALRFDTLSTRRTGLGKKRKRSERGVIKGASDPPIGGENFLRYF